MITKVTSLTKLKQLFTELFLNKTDRVSDISDNSVLNATAFGIAKVAQKAMKDISVVEARIFPETAVGEDLDKVAQLLGVSPRRGALGSSTYLRVIADPGTSYEAAIHTFVGNNGVVFELEDDFSVPDVGFTYVKVRSIDTGSKTVVDAESIIAVVPIPTGHIAVTNEYQSVGGVDAESDEVFRQRIINNKNLLSTGTLEFYTQLFQEFDDRVLRLINLGTNDLGKRELAVVTQNGVDLTPSELSNLLESVKPYFSITEVDRFGDLIGVELVNVTWYEVGGSTGIDFRVDIPTGTDPVEVRKEIQINISKYLDFRFWDSSRRVEWDKLLRIVQDTEGVRYVPDNSFNPNVDETVPLNQLPRVSGFVMRDLGGNIIYTSGGVLSPVFYPNE